MLTEATLENLRRKSGFIDRVQMHDGAPLWSWCDLSLTELCNRVCAFCPRADATFYPNQPLHMPLSLARKIADELCSLSYDGSVVLCGFGEPLLHPNVEDIVSCFGCRLEIVTNGDHLDVPFTRLLANAGVDCFVVSMYDGPHQVEPLKAMFEEAGIGPEGYVLRDRWHGAADAFGLKLTNRGGTVSAGEQDAVDTARACHYTAYQMTVDWNGDVLLCSQDWHKKVKYGNLALQSMVDVWTSRAMHKRRMQLIGGRRSEAPCSACNTDGCLHGFNHAEAWSR